MAREKLILQNGKSNSYFVKYLIYISFILIALFVLYNVAVLPKLNQLHEMSYNDWYNDSVYQDYLIGIVTAFVLLIINVFLFINSKMGVHFVGVLMVKIILVLVLSLYIDSIYLPDKDGYFGNGVYNFEHVKEWGFSGTMVMHYMIYYLTLVIPSSYYSVKVLFVTLSTYGLYFLYLSAQRYAYRYNKTFFYILLLSPSAIAWGGEISKDVILLFFVGLFFYLSSRIGKSRNSSFYIVAALLPLIGAFFIREWFSIILFPVYFYYIFSLRLKLRNNLLYNAYKYLSSFIVAAAGYYGFNLFLSFYNNLEYYRSAFTGGGSSVDFSPLAYGIYSIVIYPLYVMIFPFIPLTLGGGFASISAIFNMAILFIFLIVLRNGWRYLSGAGLEYLSYILLWACIYSPFVSNYGTLDRYKLVMYPVLFVYIFVLINAKYCSPLVGRTGCDYKN
jgi:hypothetical protein